MRNLLLTASLSALTTFGACDIEGLGLEGDGECTLIGCHDTLTVELTPAIDDRYDAEVELDGVFVTFACDDGLVVGGAGQVLGCGSGGFQLLARASQVGVTVSGNVEKWEAFGSGTPATEENRPNGPFCEPVCTDGHLTVFTEQL